MELAKDRVFMYVRVKEKVLRLWEGTEQQMNKLLTFNNRYQSHRPDFTNNC